MYILWYYLLNQSFFYRSVIISIYSVQFFYSLDLRNLFGIKCFYIQYCRCVGISVLGVDEQTVNIVYVIFIYLLIYRSDPGGCSLQGVPGSFFGEALWNIRLWRVCTYDSGPDIPRVVRQSVIQWPTEFDQNYKNDIWFL